MDTLSETSHEPFTGDKDTPSAHPLTVAVAIDTIHQFSHEHEVLEEEN
jgi:hypothetical protein